MNLNEGEDEGEGEGEGEGEKLPQSLLVPTRIFDSILAEEFKRRHVCSCTCKREEISISPGTTSLKYPKTEPSRQNGIQEFHHRGHAGSRRCSPARTQSGTFGTRQSRRCYQS
eukprot:741132-Hanusia_phi.AAC.2